jgi:hypothetical protein
MDHDEIDRRCDELRSFVDKGPGANPVAARKAFGGLATFQVWDHKDSVKKPLVDLNDEFRAWISASRWKGQDDGIRAREVLVRDIEKLRAAMYSLNPV